MTQLDFYVYRYRNLVNGKLYFGKGIHNRIYDHCVSARYSASDKDTCLVRALRKYGVNKFEITIMMDHLSENEAHLIERFYIRKFNTNQCRGGWGYNQTDGGEGTKGLKWSEESRAKRRGKNNPLVRAGVDRTGANNPMFRRSPSEFVRKMTSERFMGSKHPNSKLIDSDIPKILELSKTKSPGKIAKEYNVSRRAIRNILSGLSWKHIPRE